MKQYYSHLSYVFCRNKSNLQVYKSRRDVECEARPRHVSKYVACRPNSRSKSTTITKGDLFDENEERLKLCQGELATTRRQVHVLQQKLISIMQDKADKRVQIRRRIACVVDREPEAQKADVEKLESLQTKNAELREQEKSALVRSERERILHLVNEFENVRRELDQEMSRYESEKSWLKSRIRNLETDNEELQRTIEARGEGSDTSRDRKADLTVFFRKTLSEPELGNDDDETARLRAENVTLKRFVHVHLTFRNPFSTGEWILSLVLSLFVLGASSRGVSSNDFQNILETVMMGWEADERKNLIRDLKRSRQELKGASVQRLSHELNEARAELEVYRREGVHARTVTPRVVRSSSLGSSARRSSISRNFRWKEKCGTMFRELNAMRAGYQRAQEERRELKIQLAMLRGELEMSSVYFSPLTATVESNNPAPFDRGSTRESVVCRISAATPQRNERARSRSEQRKRTASTKISFEAKERRRSARKVGLAFFLVQFFLILFIYKIENDTQALSQSWHESGEHLPPPAQHPVHRRESRVVSLREKVGQLSRENRLLQEELAAATAAVSTYTLSSFNESPEFRDGPSLHTVSSIMSFAKSTSQRFPGAAVYLVSSVSSMLRCYVT
ncbi:unnamed protein product [Heligmosomoides polygyrus]|uniref:Uncharacterized protein n=1 Tax=Heligmosomoides polygyrus TaxID=6339 RepID=A0A3P8CUY0_HELPZ|nr:unnamed protein product [Heligmosomoides polygyrus]